MGQRVFSYINALHDVLLSNQILRAKSFGHSMNILPLRTALTTYFKHVGKKLLNRLERSSKHSENNLNSPFFRVNWCTRRFCFSCHVNDNITLKKTCEDYVGYRDEPIRKTADYWGRLLLNRLSQRIGPSIGTCRFVFQKAREKLQEGKKWRCKCGFIVYNTYYR